MNENYTKKLNHGHIKWANRPEIIADIAEKAATLPIEVEPLGEIAYHAHGNRSWEPEIRYLQEEQWYIFHLAEVWAEMANAPGGKGECIRRPPGGGTGEMGRTRTDGNETQPWPYSGKIWWQDDLFR